MRKFFSKANLSKPINIYRIGLLIVFFTAFFIVPFTPVNVSFLTFYLIVAFIGLHLFELHGYRAYHLSQLGFLFFTIYLFSGGNILQLADFDFMLSKHINPVFFFASYSLIIFYLFVVLFHYVKSIKRRNIYYISLISLLWAGSSYRIFFIPELGAFVGFVFLGFFVVSTVSFIIIQRKVIKKIYLVFFQAAFFGSLLFSVYNISFFEKKVITNDALDIYIVGTWGLTSIFLIWLLLDRLFITYWRRKLVEIPATLESGKPISIYPDATIYKDVHQNAAWLDKFIRTSDGGVVGLTGVRGAGKSALLNKILADLDKEYFTLHITSPVHSSDQMEFFMMVCREVCSKVIREVNTKIFHSKNTVISKARDGLISRIRYFLLFIVVMAGIIVAFNHGLLSGTLGFNGGQMTGVQDHEGAKDDLLKADHDCIAKLVVDLDKFQADNSSLHQAIILPRANQSQLHLMPVLDSLVNISNIYNVFMKRYDWMNAREWDNIYLFGKNVLRDTTHSAWLYNQDLFSAEELFEGSTLNPEVFNTIYFTQLIRPSVYNNLSLHMPVDYYFGDLYFDHFYDLFRYSRANTLALYESSDLDESQIAHYVSTVGEMLNIEPGFLDIEANERFPKLMSWLLLEAFITHAHNGNKESLLLDRNTSIPKLKDILINYLNLFPSEYGPTPVSTSGQTKSLKSLSIFNALNSGIYWLLAGLFVLILVAGLIYKWFSYSMASIVNFKAFGLLQQSKQFLSLLSYSESTERSGSLSVWDWLSFSASKTKTERDLTLPAITNRFVTYIKEVSASFNNKMIICIDELDKIDDPEVIRHILREIKGALFVKNTYYLISISEDAASSFETRLSSGRDIFESTFDEIIFLKRLHSGQTQEIIKLRLAEEEEIIRDLKIENVKEGEGDRQTNADLIKSNASVISIASGGIPREIIRNLREVLLKYTKFDQATTSQISVFLFRKKIEKLLNRAGEVSIAGDRSMELYNCLIEILKGVENGEGLAENQISNVRGLLKKCLSIIDPDELSSSVTITSSKEQQAGYDAIKTDLKSYIELLIFTDVIEYFQNNATVTEIDEHFEERIISTFTSLDKNPALALHILKEK